MMLEAVPLSHHLTRRRQLFSSLDSISHEHQISPYRTTVKNILFSVLSSDHNREPTDVSQHPIPSALTLQLCIHVTLVLFTVTTVYL